MSASKYLPQRSMVESHVSNLLEWNRMEEILPHGDEKVNLLRPADILLFNSKAFAKLGIGFSFWRIRKRTDCVQSVAQKLVYLSSYIDWDRVDLGLHLCLCCSDSGDCQ